MHTPKAEAIRPKEGRGLTQGTDQIWIWGSFGECLSWGTVDKAERGAQNEGGPEERLMSYLLLRPGGPTWGSSEAGQGLCLHIVP